MDEKTLDWLREPDNPPVRYLTLKYITGSRESELKNERAKINGYLIIRKILRHQATIWGKDKNLYRKYRGGYWNLIFLGDLYANGDDERIRKGVEFILADDLWHRRIDGCSTQWICLAANVSRAMANLGYADDPRLRAHIENIAAAILKNDGIVCSVMEYSLLPQCYMALPKALMALGAYTGKKRIVKQAINVASEKLLARQVYRYLPDRQDEWNENYEKLSTRLKTTKSKPNGGTLKEELAAVRPAMLGRIKYFKPKPGWVKFGYPLHYNSDLLEAMRSMMEAGVKYDRRLDDALDVIEGDRMPDGRWKLGYSLNGKMWVDIEKKGKPSKWVTYHALRVLSAYGRI